MDEKLGKGGNGMQPFTSDGKYAADSGVSDEEITDYISSNPKLSSAFASLSPEKRGILMQRIRDALSANRTKERMSERFDPIGVDEYRAMASDCAAAVSAAYGEDAQNVLDAFYSGYMGAGQRSFNFNKCLRLGYDEARKWYDGMLNERGWSDRGDFPSREEVADRVERLDRLTNAWGMPRDSNAFRYVDENWVVSAFRDLVDGFGIVKDPYGYDSLDKKSVSVDELVDALSNAVGKKIDGDSGFTSVSMVPKMSHMEKHSDEERFKRIHLSYDIPKGTPMFVSNYERESEALFPRGTNFFVKDVGKETDENGRERVVILFGIR